MPSRDSNSTIQFKDQDSLVKLAGELGLTVKNFDLLRMALTHRSFVNESSKALEHNERLEFLGDAVLELVITEFLFSKFPTRAEGELTSFRAALVKTESLAEESQKMGLGKYIFMSKGEEMTGGRERPYILANTFESLLGFVYLDQGYEACKSFVSRYLTQKIDKIVENRSDIDNKSKLQELSQEIVKITPSYELIEESGPDHEKMFTMAARIGDYEFGRGIGHSKQIAAQYAAYDALKNWKENVKKYFNIEN